MYKNQMQPIYIQVAVAAAMIFFWCYSLREYTDVWNYCGVCVTAFKRCL